jgi:hypothetical protein
VTTTYALLLKKYMRRLGFEAMRYGKPPEKIEPKNNAAATVMKANQSRFLSLTIDKLN